MRTIKRTSQFKQDYKRKKNGRHRSVLDKILPSIITKLVADKLLPRRYFDHALKGNW